MCTYLTEYIEPSSKKKNSMTSPQHYDYYEEWPNSLDEKCICGNS
jgi:hypothetical protein